jgi:hypothetical protein
MGAGRVPGPIGSRGGRVGETRILLFAFVLAVIADGNTASAAPRPTISLACKVALVPSPKNLRVKVGNRELSLTPVEKPPQDLRVYPATKDAVLVAYSGHDANGPYGSAVLWRVPCKAGEPEVVASIEHADFGHAAPAKNGRTLFFTGADGAFALDLASYQAQRLTQPKREVCQNNQLPTRDVVGDFVDARTLAIERGCGFEFEWHALPVLLRDPGTPKMKEEAIPRPPPSSVAVGADGMLWLADGSCKESKTYGRVMVSSDRGEHWRQVPVKMPEPQPVRQVIADRSKPGAALVFTSSCGSAAHVVPGWVYLTQDAGKTFRPFTVPSGIPAGEDGGPAAEQDPIQAVTAIDGSLTRVVLFGESQQVEANKTARWETRDRGRTWKDLPPVAAAPKVSPPTISTGDAELDIRKDGLYRTRKGEAPVRIYPRD